MALTDFARAMKEAENAPDQMLIEEIAQEASTTLEPLPAALEKSRRDKMRNQSQRPTTTVLQDIAMQSQKPPMMPPGMPGGMPQGPAPQMPPGIPPQMPPGMPPQMPPAMPPQMPPAQGGIRGFFDGGLTNGEDKSFGEEVVSVFTPDAADLGLMAMGATGFGAAVAGPALFLKKLKKIISLGPKAYRAYKGFLGKQAAKRLPERVSQRIAGGESLADRLAAGGQQALERFASGRSVSPLSGIKDEYYSALGTRLNRGMMGGIGGAMLGNAMFGGKDSTDKKGDTELVSPETYDPQDTSTYPPRDFGMPSRNFEAEINLSRDENIADIMSLGEDIRALDQYKFDKGRGFFNGGLASGLNPQLQRQLEEIEKRERVFSGMGSSSSANIIPPVMESIGGGVSNKAQQIGDLGSLISSGVANKAQQIGDLGLSIADKTVDVGAGLGSAILAPGYEYPGFTSYAQNAEPASPELIEAALRVQGENPDLDLFDEEYLVAEEATPQYFPTSTPKSNPDSPELFAPAREVASSGALLGSGTLRNIMGLDPTGPIMTEGIGENVTESVASDPSPQGGGASYRDYLNEIFTANKEKHDRMQKGMVLGQIASNLLSGERDFMRGIPDLAFGTMGQDIQQQRDLGNVGINMLASDTGLAGDQLRARISLANLASSARSKSIDQLISNQEQLNRGNLFNLEARNNAMTNYVELSLKVMGLVSDYAAANGLEADNEKVVAFKRTLDERIAPLNPANIPT